MSIFATNKAIVTLRDDLNRLATTVRDMQSANRSLELEFTELYDKVRHQMSRMAKRAAVEAKSAENGEDVQPAESLEPEIDPISAKILRRRGIRRQAE